MHSLAIAVALEMSEAVIRPARSSLYPPAFSYPLADAILYHIWAMTLSWRYCQTNLTSHWLVSNFYEWQHKTPSSTSRLCPKIIRLEVMYYVRYPLSFPQVEDILHERGIDICHETIRFWVDQFGAKFAKEIRKKRVGQHSNWQWYLDEVFVKINAVSGTKKLSIIWFSVNTSDIKKGCVCYELHGCAQERGNLGESDLTKRTNQSRHFPFL